jgi:hypothetical protein
VAEVAEVVVAEARAVGEAEAGDCVRAMVNVIDIRFHSHVLVPFRLRVTWTEIHRPCRQRFSTA